MIKTIIKRDGSIEPFDASKLNRWSEWASKTLGKYVDWTTVVLSTVSKLGDECTSQTLQERLIKTCLDENTWSYNRMAGRLYAALTSKQLYGNTIPTIKQVHTRLVEAGFMVDLGYSDEEYAAMELVINHRRDLDASYFELQHIRMKYALKNAVTKEEFETQQFVYMRMAMALATTSKKEDRIKDATAWYNHLSLKHINAPTPNFVNLGTPLRGFASCNVYTTLDTAKSLAVGDHIAYMMTCMSAGIGAHINTRSLGDPVRNGRISHQGKLPYYRALNGAVHANLQAGRGGACTVYYNCFDPEALTISQLKNPMSTDDKRIRGMDYAFSSNRFFAMKAAKNEDIFTFNSFTAPDLWDAFYSADENLFEALYKKYESDKSFTKNWVSARELLIIALNEAHEVGREYLHFPLEANRHTPFKEPIYSSNLCTEINLPTHGYSSMEQLYSDDATGYVILTFENGEETRVLDDSFQGLNDGSVLEAFNLKVGDVLYSNRKIAKVEYEQPPEIGLCSLAGICVDHIKTDEEYESAMYYALKMIDHCIDQSEYVLPQLGVTAKARRSAGVGIVGLAHYMAMNHLSYSSQAGRDEFHRVAERHMYFAIRGSLRLGKELGVADWMYKTKWIDGWLPLDTYNKNIDSLTQASLQYDWESLRQEILEAKGIRNSVLIALMPSESSSIASGTTNSIYPIRSLSLIKGDANKVTYWAAPEGEKLQKWYESAWDIPQSDLIKMYGIFQKFIDQGISADLFVDISSKGISSTEMMQTYFNMIKYGMKARYYVNTLTSKSVSLEVDVDAIPASDEVCESCTL